MSSSGDSAIKAAIFDLGGVVLDVSHGNAADYWTQAVGVEPGKIQVQLKEGTCYASFERGEISPETFHQRVSADLGRPISYDDLLEGWNSVIRGVVPGVGELLAELSRTIRLAVLSNTNLLHAGFFMKRYAEIFDYFEKVFLSHEIGTRKPEPQSFQLVLDRLGLRAGETVFIDDKPGNVTVARQLGMKGIVAGSTEQIRRDLRSLGIDLAG